MKSLYDLLGVRADDDAQALKKAFRRAVKEHHPDLHPDNPEAALQFRRIVTANAILRDAKQRAAYDQQLERERQRAHVSLEAQRLAAEARRQQFRLKRIRIGAAAIGVVCVAAGGYGLLAPLPSIMTATKDKPAAAAVAPGKTAAGVDTGKKDRPAATAIAASKRNENASAAIPVTDTGVVQDDMDHADTPAQTAGAQLAARVVPADRGGPPQHNDSAENPGEAPKPGAASSTTDRSGVTAAADRGSVPDLGLGSRPGPAPNDANFYRELGIASYRFGDFPLAIVNLDMAIRRNPDDAQAHNIRGNAWDEIGLFDNALADYDEAIRIDPNNPIFFHDRAVLWHRKGDLDKALIDLDRAIRFSFSDPALYCDRGLVWYEKGRHERAIADFNHAIKLDPNFAAAYINRGLILHRNSEFTVAFADLGKTIHVDPGVFDAVRHMK